MDKRPHARSTQFIESCAQSFQVEVQPFDTDKWSAGFTIAKALDCLVDDDHVYQSGGGFNKVLAGKTIAYLEIDEAEFVRTTYEGLDELSQQRWHRAASLLGAYALKRLEAVNVEEYLDVVSDESQLMSDVLLIENDQERADYAKREQFNTWMRQMARTAYMLDTLSDLVRDYNDANMNIQPTVKVASQTAQRAIAELAEFIPMTPAPVYGAVMRRSLTKIIEKTSRLDFWSRQFFRSRSG